MATAIIRPTGHIDHSSSSYVINNMAYMYDDNNDTYAQGKSSLYGYGILTGFNPTQLQIQKINKITLCVLGELSGSSGSTAKAKIVYNATSTTNYTDCGDGSLEIPLSGSVMHYKIEYPKATAYWNDNISSFLNGGLQVMLVNVISTKHLHEVYIEVEYEGPAVTVTTSVSPAEGGTVTGGGTYESGSTVTVTAIPNSGYAFSHWEIGGVNVGTTNPASGALTEDTAITAVFEKVSKIRYGTDIAKSVFDTSKNKAKSVWYGTTQIL